MSWQNIRFFLITFIISVLFFKPIGAFMERTALVCANIKPVLSASISKQKHGSQKDWITSPFSEEFVESAWKTARAHYGISSDVKRPEVLVSYDKSDPKDCGSANLEKDCVLGHYLPLSESVVIYPYRLAYITIGNDGNGNVFSENRKTFLAYSEATLAHEFLHYFHHLDSIPLKSSHCVMLADQIKIAELMVIISEKHNCGAKFLIYMELLYLKEASEKCRK